MTKKKFLKGHIFKVRMKYDIKTNINSITKNMTTLQIAEYIFWNKENIIRIDLIHKYPKM